MSEVSWISLIEILRNAFKSFPRNRLFYLNGVWTVKILETKSSFHLKDEKLPETLNFSEDILGSFESRLRFCHPISTSVSTFRGKNNWFFSLKSICYNLKYPFNEFQTERWSKTNNSKEMSNVPRCLQIYMLFWNDKNILSFRWNIFKLNHISGEVGSRGDQARILTPWRRWWIH